MSGSIVLISAASGELPAFGCRASATDSSRSLAIDASRTATAGASAVAARALHGSARGSLTPGTRASEMMGGRALHGMAKASKAVSARIAGAGDAEEEDAASHTKSEDAEMISGEAKTPSKKDTARARAGSLIDVDGPLGTVSVRRKVNELATETCIIFDWDDTLLSSSWLAGQGFRLDYPLHLPSSVVKSMAALQESVIALLTRASGCGNVIIITNAETGWVELSARKFMPKVVPLLSKVKVLSARSTFEPEFPDPADWKVQAFWQELSAHVEDVRDSGKAKRAQCLSLGDSIHEREALHKVTDAMEGVQSKSVKFVERPDAEQLRQQVDMIHGCFEDLCLHGGNLDLLLSLQYVGGPRGHSGPSLGP